MSKLIVQNNSLKKVEYGKGSSAWKVGNRCTAYVEKTEFERNFVDCSLTGFFSEEATNGHACNFLYVGGNTIPAGNEFYVFQAESAGVDSRLVCNFSCIKK